MRISTSNMQSTYIISTFNFYTPWKRQKTSGWLMFPGDREIEYWHEIGHDIIQQKCNIFNEIPRQQMTEKDFYYL